MMRAVDKTNSEIEARKPMIVFVGFSTTSFKIYSVALKAAFPDFTCFAVQSTPDIWAELSRRDIGLIIAGHDHCAAIIEMDQALKDDFPGASLCVAYDGRACLSQCHQTIIRNHPRFSLLAMDIRLDVWVAAVSLMLSGGRYVQPELMVVHAPPMAANDQNGAVHQPSNGALIEKLTPREQEVLALVADGLQNKIIADRLHLSEHTIKLHMHHIFSKLGVTNRTQAATLYHHPPALSVE